MENLPHLYFYALLISVLVLFLGTARVPLENGHRLPEILAYVGRELRKDPTQVLTGCLLLFLFFSFLLHFVSHLFMLLGK